MDRSRSPDDAATSAAAWITGRGEPSIPSGKVGQDRDVSTPAPPIIVDEHGDISFYASVTEAERDLEAVDVRAGEYQAFDSLGQRLRLTTEGETVQIDLDLAAGPDPGELETRLMRLVDRVGSDRIGFEDRGAGLPDLVAALARFFGLEQPKA